MLCLCPRLNSLCGCRKALCRPALPVNGRFRKERFRAGLLKPTLPLELEQLQVLGVMQALEASTNRFHFGPIPMCEGKKLAPLVARSSSRLLFLQRRSGFRRKLLRLCIDGLTDAGVAVGWDEDVSRACFRLSRA